MFALPLHYEGFPNILLEVMQAGIPSITFDCPGGVAEIIQSEKNGVLVTVEGADGLADALRRLAQDAVLRTTLGENAKKVNERLAPSVLCARWIELTWEYTEAGRT